MLNRITQTTTWTKHSWKSCRKMVTTIMLRRQAGDNPYGKASNRTTLFTFFAADSANVRQYEYWSVVLESTIISQHISSIVIFVAIFIYLHFEFLSSHALITMGTVGTVIGYGFWDWSNTMLTPDSNYQRMSTTMFFFLPTRG